MFSQPFDRLRNTFAHPPHSLRLRVVRRKQRPIRACLLLHLLIRPAAEFALSIARQRYIMKAPGNRDPLERVDVRHSSRSAAHRKRSPRRSAPHEFRPRHVPP